MPPARAPSFEDPIPPRPPRAVSFDEQIPPRPPRAPSFDEPIPPRLPGPGRPLTRGTPSASNRPPRSSRGTPTLNLPSTSRSTARVPPLGIVNAVSQLARGASNLCFFCRQGGYVLSCILCGAFASCITKGDFIGCLPERYLDEDRFICPNCYKSTGLAPRYSVPSRAAASTHAGVNTSPLIVYFVYLDEGPHSRAPATTLGGQARGYFHGKEEQLLVLVHPFKDLSDNNEKSVLVKNVGSMAAFIHSAPGCRFVLVLQTHADPTSGLLHFSAGKCTTIDVVLEHILRTLRHHQFSNSVLLLSSCGYFVRRHFSSLKDAIAAFGFKSSFSFTGYSLDPLLVTVALYYHILDFHIVGNETSRKALERSACVSLLTNTSVVLIHAGDALVLCGAAVRYRPNGSYISCRTCLQPADYRKILKGGQTAVYRCRETEHKESRYQAVTLLQSDETRTVVGGLNDRCRYIATRIPFDADVQFWNDLAV